MAAQTPRAGEADARAEDYIEVRVTRLNLRFLVILLVAGILLAAGFYIVHGHQTRRNAVVLKKRAEAALEKGETQSAISYFRQYVGLNPDDVDAQVALGDLLSDSALNSQQLTGVFKIYEQVLAREPERDDVRRRQVDVSMRLGRYSDAIAHLAILVEPLKNKPAAWLAAPAADREGDSGEADRLDALLTLAGDCYRASAKTREAVGLYVQALALAEDRIASYTGLIASFSGESAQVPAREDLLDGVPKSDFGLALGKSAPEKVRRNLEALQALFPADESEEFAPRWLVEKLLTRMVEFGRPAPEALLRRAQFRLAASAADDALPENSAAAQQRAQALLSQLDGDPKDGVLNRSEFVGSHVVSPLADEENDGRLTTEELQRYFEIGDQAARYNAAQKDLSAALQLAPDDPDALLSAARLALVRAELERDKGEADDALLQSAREYAEHGLKQQPIDLRLYVVLADLEKVSGKTPDDQYSRAEAHYRAALRAMPGLLQAAPPREQLAIQATAAQIQWSLADLLISQAQLRSPADEEKLGEAAKLMEELQKHGMRPPGLEFLGARRALAQKSRPPDIWYQVSHKLQTIRHDLRSRRDLVRRIDLMLGECYERLANPDARLDVFRRAVQDDPLWAQGRVNLASAYVAQNRIDDALQEYQLYSGAPAVAVEIARLQIVQELSRPESDRRQQRWDAILAYLDEAEKRAGDSKPELVLLPILRAEVLALKKAYDEASRVLELALEQFSDEPRVWTTAAGLELVRQDRAPEERFAAAEAILQKAREKLGDNVDLRLAAANLAAALPREQAKLSLQELEAENKDFAPEERARLLEGLARAYGRIKADDDAGRIWNRVAEENPNELRYQLVLVELARRDGDAKRLRTLIESIRRIEGPAGPNGNLVEAEVLMRELAQTNDGAAPRDMRKLEQALARPRNLLRQAARQRPLWAAAPQMLGNVEWALQNRELAVEHYQKAISLGSRSQDVIQRVVQQLSIQRRYEEADRLLTEVQQDVSHVASGELARLKAEVAWQQQDFAESISIARDDGSVPKTFEDRLWRANVFSARYQRLSVADRRGEMGQRLLSDSERLYREAIELAPEKPDVWLSYVVHLGRSEEKERALAVIREAQENLPAEPKHSAPMTLAKCYETIGEWDRAEEHYEAALAAGSNDVGARMLLADFHSRRGDAAKAQEHVEWILDPNSSAPAHAVEWAKRRKALLIASRGTYQDALSAFDMLKTETPSVADLRAQATILARRGTRREQRMLIDVLEQIAQQQPLQPPERFQLARLYDTTGEERMSDRLMHSLLSDFPEDTVFLSWYTERLIARGELEAAATSLTRLERLQPEFFGTVGLRAKLMAAEGQIDEAAALLKTGLQNQTAVSPSDALRTLVLQGQSEEALRLLEQIAAESMDQVAAEAVKDARAALAMDDADHAIRIIGSYVQSQTLDAMVMRMNYKAAADLLADIGRPDEAEAVYRDYVQKSGSPEEILNVVPYVARQGQIDRALDLCERAVGICKPQTIAAMCLLVLNERPPSSSQFARVEKWLTEAAHKVPDSMYIAAQIASLRDLQGRYSEAEAIYRSMLAKNNRAVLPLNNLAWLLAIQQKNLAEAEQLVNRAIDMAGPLPELLDTRGWVHLARGESEKAVSDLEMCVSSRRSAAALFHLALAYKATGDRTAARQALRSAEEAGLRVQTLHALERPAYERLQRDLPSSGSSG